MFWKPQNRMVARRPTRRGLHLALALWLLCFAAAPAAAKALSPVAEITAPGVLTGAGNPASPQEVSSFYLRLYQSGEKAFRENRYRDAAGDLEIAVFGLANDKTLYAKAQLYLAICFNFMAMRPKVETALMQAARLLGPQDVKSFGFDEEVLALLREIVEDYKVDIEIPPPPAPIPVPDKVAATPPVAADPLKKTAPPADKKVAAPPTAGSETAVKSKTSPEKKTDPPPPRTSEPPEKSKPPAADLVFVQKPGEKTPPAESAAPLKKPEKKSLPDVKPLERRLKSESDNAALIEELASLYLLRGEPKKAKAILEKYLGIRPKDLSAVFSLAKAHYFLKDYRAAMDGLQSVSTPDAEAALAPETNLKVAVFKALCLFALGQDGSAAAYLNFVTANAGSEDLARILGEENVTAPWKLMADRLRR